MGTEPPFSTRVASRNSVTSIALTGELDMATVPILDDQLAALEHDGATAIILDLRDLSFLDVSGLHALVRAHRSSEQNGHRLMVVGATSSTRRVCELTGTTFLLDAKGTAELLGRFTGDSSEDGQAGDEPHV